MGLISKSISSYFYFANPFLWSLEESMQAYNGPEKDVGGCGGCPDSLLRFAARIPHRSERLSALPTLAMPGTALPQSTSFLGSSLRGWVTNRAVKGCPLPLLRTALKGHPILRTPKGPGLAESSAETVSLHLTSPLCQCCFLPCLCWPQGHFLIKLLCTKKSVSQGTQPVTGSILASASTGDKRRMFWGLGFPFFLWAARSTWTPPRAEKFWALAGNAGEPDASWVAPGWAN